MSAATKAKPSPLDLAALLRELDRRGVALSLDGGRVRWRGTMTSELLDAARDHREAIAEYLRKRCVQCGHSRLVMVMMESNGAVWWLCAECWCG